MVQKCKFLSTFKVKNVHVEVGGGKKRTKLCPRSHWMPPSWEKIRNRKTKLKQQESIRERLVCIRRHYNWSLAGSHRESFANPILLVRRYHITSAWMVHSAVLWLTLRSMIKIVDTMAIVANVKVKFRINSSEMISLASHWMYIMQYAIGESKRLALRGLADISWSDMSKVISDRPVFKDC